MVRYDRRTWGFAACLSFIAGFVDALAFLELGGFFVSFMSGNSTRLGVGLADGRSAAAMAAGLIGLFISGVVVGSYLAGFAGKRRQAVALSIVAALLLAAALAATLNHNGVAIAAMALAMGAENTVFEHNDEVTIGVTYMTGTLVKAGQRISAALRGRNRWAWAPYLLLWGGLVIGAMTGGMVYPAWGLRSLWLVSLTVAILAIFAAVSPQEMTGHESREQAGPTA